MNTLLYIDIPENIKDAVDLVHTWALENGHEGYKLGNIMHRNYYENQIRILEKRIRAAQHAVNDADEYFE